MVATTVCSLFKVFVSFLFQADADKIKDLQEKLKEAKSRGDEVRVQSEKNSHSFQNTK